MAAATQERRLLAVACKRLFGVTVRGTDPHRLYSLTQAPLSIQRGIRLHRTETELLDVHFISSSPVELQLAYRVEGDTRHVQSVEGGD